MSALRRGHATGLCQLREQVAMQYEGLLRLGHDSGDLVFVCVDAVQTSAKSVRQRARPIRSAKVVERRAGAV